MADGVVQLAPDSTGKKIDTSELTVSSQTVERQRIVIADTTTAAALAAVSGTTPIGTEYGIITRNIACGPAYAASSAAGGFVPGATPQDIFTLTGSATKTVRITRVTIDGTATAATTCPIVILKRSTANTGGTSSSLTAVPYDANSAAATATALSYTANPTAGTLVGNIRTYLTYLPTPTTISHPLLDIQFGLEAQEIVLRGTSQVFAVNLNGIAAISGWKFSITVEWSEE